MLSRWSEAGRGDGVWSPLIRSPYCHGIRLTRQQAAALAAAIGNGLEWFDFAVYGSFAVDLGRLFFPRSDQSLQLIVSFGVFVIGYLMRPLGSLLLTQFAISRSPALAGAFSTATAIHESLGIALVLAVGCWRNAAGAGGRCSTRCCGGPPACGA